MPGPLASTLPRAHADYDESVALQDMVRADPVAERVAVESYRERIVRVGDKDPTARLLPESLLCDEEEHADERADLREE